MQGCIFDIREFSIHDGPGPRITIFMKGCPLRCKWCHNPEGLSFKPQINNETNKEKGRLYSVGEIVEYINRYKNFFISTGGGVTFSGGEPTAQGEFVFECCKNIKNVHRILDTSGYCNKDIFIKLLSEIDLVLFDIKLANPELHEKYTGKSNKLILDNLETICKQKKDYYIRIPLIPNITDTDDNLSEINKIILSLDCKPKYVDLLPYNPLAGGKYKQFGMDYPLKNGFTKNNLDNVYVFMNNLIKEGIKTKIKGGLNG